LLPATLFAHESAGFDVQVPAGLGGDVVRLGRPAEAGEQASLARVRPAWPWAVAGQAGRLPARPDANRAPRR